MSTRSRRPSASTLIYWGLIGLFALLTAVSIYLPYGNFAPAATQGPLPAPRPVIALVAAVGVFLVYGGLGYLGLFLARRLSFADVWDSHVTNRQRFLWPAAIGVALGIIFIASDLLFGRFFGVARLPHPPFPTSLVASLTAAIGEEALFRLFFIPFWLWLISSVLLRGRGREAVFWGVTLASAVAFAAGHLPSFLLLSGAQNPAELGPALLVEIFLLNGVLSVAAGATLRRWGFLAPVGIHFWADFVWHVLWGGLG
jgi:hypothetical protein